MLLGCRIRLGILRRFGVSGRRGLRVFLRLLRRVKGVVGRVMVRGVGVIVVERR